MNLLRNIGNMQDGNREDRRYYDVCASLVARRMEQIEGRTIDEKVTISVSKKGKATTMDVPLPKEIYDYTKNGKPKARPFIPDNRFMLWSQTDTENYTQAIGMAPPTKREEAMNALNSFLVQRISSRPDNRLYAYRWLVICFNEARGDHSSGITHIFMDGQKAMTAFMGAQGQISNADYRKAMDEFLHGKEEGESKKGLDEE